MKNMYIGRLGLVNFWLGIVVLFILSGILGSALGQYSNSIVGSMLGLILFFIISLLLFSFLIRRIHDHNKSGWNLIWSFVPIYGLYILFLLFYVPGSKESNRFGLPKSKISLKTIFALEPINSKNNEE